LFFQATRGVLEKYEKNKTTKEPQVCQNAISTGGDHTQLTYIVNKTVFHQNCIVAHNKHTTVAVKEIYRVELHHLK